MMPILIGLGMIFCIFLASYESDNGNDFPY